LITDDSLIEGEVSKTKEYWVSENMQFKSLLTPNLALVWGLFIVQVIKETKNVTSN
jgi:hypothetical protein